MKTIDEIRKINLQTLVNDNDGIAALCRKVGMPESTIGRIINGNVRHDRGGKPYQMGDSMARDLEKALDLEVGWMDNLAASATLAPESISESAHPDIDAAVKTLADHINALSPQQYETALDQINLLARSPDSARARAALVQTLSSGEIALSERRFQA